MRSTAKDPSEVFNPIAKSNPRNLGGGGGGGGWGGGREKKSLGGLVRLERKERRSGGEEMEAASDSSQLSAPRILFCSSVTIYMWSYL